MQLYLRYTKKVYIYIYIYSESIHFQFISHDLFHHMPFTVTPLGCRVDNLNPRTICDGWKQLTSLYRLVITCKVMQSVKAYIL